MLRPQSRPYLRVRTPPASLPPNEPRVPSRWTGAPTPACPPRCCALGRARTFLYERSLRPCLGTSIASPERAPFRQRLLARDLRDEHLAAGRGLVAVRFFARDAQRSEALRRHAGPEGDLAALVERSHRHQHPGRILEPG